MIQLYFANYKLFDYEYVLALREIKALFPMAEVTEKKELIEIDLNGDDSEIMSKLLKLTYFSKFKISENTYETYQSILESSCPKSGKSKRQSTRYGAHGLHEYKGKFNPQIVSTLLNILKLEQHSRVLEPFCGSGTTLYESQLKGYIAEGFDYNPMAVFIANTKLGSLNIKKEDLEKGFKEIILHARAEFHILTFDKCKRINYLEKWFDEINLKKIESLKIAVERSLNKEVGDLVLCIASNILRDYSLQEPADLRIRRRKSPMPDKCFYEKLENEVGKFSQSFSQLPKVVNIKRSKAFNIDIRDTECLSSHGRYDAAITSPPYATALPYIDTQRLSIVWLGLATPEEIKGLESGLIGSRELLMKERKILDERLTNNEALIPKSLLNLVMKMKESLKDSDGFRRQAMPHVVYRYFSDMKKMFENTLNMMNLGGRFALVVGHNHTTLGGVKFDLDTPDYLSQLAQQVGWVLDEIIPLEVYRRYDLHKKNSIASESLILLTKK